MVRLWIAIAVGATTLIPCTARAQTRSPIPPAAVAESTADAQTTKPANASLSTPISHRWFDLSTISFTARYRRVDTSAGVVTANHGQHNELVKAGFKFDPQGRYTIVAGLASGAAFTSGWNNSGIGTPDGLSWLISLKELYLSAAPVRGVEGQFGGLYILRGENTEITSYDNDGYMSGGRVSIKRPDAIWLDEVSATTGYLGETTTPNFLRRTKRLSDNNYFQFLAAKRFGSSFGISADLTRVDDVKTLRSAFSIKAPKSIGVDVVRLEAYRRIDNPANGYSAYVEKAVTRRFSLGVGVANIDLNYGTLNADRFGKGQRWFANSTLTLLPELSLLGFYQHAFDNSVALSNQSRLDILLQFNVLKALQRAKWYRDGTFPQPEPLPSVTSD